MSLFQKSVLKKYLSQQDNEALVKAFKKFTKYFHDLKIQENIRSLKEEEYQGIFLTELFSKILGYTMKPNVGFNLVAEYKNEKNSKKADGAIIKNGKAIAVIELKGTKTKDLEKIRQQAFDYKANQTECVYVITSNYEKIRFYINNAVDFEEFDLFHLNLDRFKLLYLCLAKENVLENTPLRIKEASTQEEETITKKFYADYSLFKRELFRDLVKLNMNNDVFRTELNNEDSERGTKNIKRTLFKKSQKLIDRFLFIFFAEDRELLPPNSTLKILEQWDKLKELDEHVPLYKRYKKYFNYLDQGRKGTDKTAEIFAYNGGLFKTDAVLDSLLISDELLYKHTKVLSHYNFESQVDVNILGHIFENSLNEIESINAEIEGADFDKQKTKRKKDGVFYTPKYITKYIVENTVGKLCTEKKAELKIIDEAYHPKRQKETKKKLLAALDVYREWLLQLTILDPACGSGAFLNQALDLLIKEHQYLDELETRLLGRAIVFSNIETTVLENNIFGVDLNEESVEIAKLSLWLRTAQPRRKLNNLSSNIKCGNSLIDSKAIAGDKAFKWEEEFPHIFKGKDKKAFHITTATHDSRTSKRMIDYKVRQLRDQGTRPEAEGIWLTSDEEIQISETIAKIVEEDKLNVLAYNICGDHMHLLLVCQENEVSKIVGKIKGKTSRLYHSNKGINPLVRNGDEKAVSLWTQKFSCKPIESDEQLDNTLNYIQNNRDKHELPALKKLKSLSAKMCTNTSNAFRKEVSGGFDVVIGNPPYVQLQTLGKMSDDLAKCGYETFHKGADLYCLFTERAYTLLKEGGVQSFIMPNKWMIVAYGKPLREFLAKTCLLQVLNFGDIQFFEEATTYVCIFSIQNKKANETVKVLSLNQKTYNGDFISEAKTNLYDYKAKNFDENYWSIQPYNDACKLEKMENNGTPLKALPISINYGIKTGYNDAFFIDNETRQRLISKDAELIKPMVRGRDITSYGTTGFEYLISTFPSLKLDIEEYPSIKEHLLSFGYDRLKQTGDKGSRKKTKGNWFETQDSIAYNKEFSKPKIIYPNMTSLFPFMYDESGILANQKCFILTAQDDTIQLRYLTAIFNSSLAKLWIWYNCPELQGGTREISKIYFENFPVPQANSEQTEKLEQWATERTELTKNSQKTSSKFQKYIQSQYPIEKLPKKLLKWHDLDFAGFIIELNKAIKKAGGERLTKMDEMDWMDVFETKKAEAQELKAEIDKTDKEIDQMVYALYGLSDEEIQIVETA